MVKVDDGGRDDWNRGFTDSGGWLGRLYDVNVNLSRRVGDIGWRISVEISLLDMTVL